MSAAELIRALQRRGVTLAANGDRLKVRAPKGTITPELRDRLAQHKPDIIAALTMPDFHTLAPICREACEPFEWIYWADLCRWLIRQRDPDWCRPEAVRWWARYVAKRGYPNET